MPPAKPGVLGMIGRALAGSLLLAAGLVAATVMGAVLFIFMGVAILVGCVIGFWFWIRLRKLSRTPGQTYVFQRQTDGESIFGQVQIIDARPEDRRDPEREE